MDTVTPHGGRWSVDPFPVSEATVQEWQEILDLLAELAEIPAALIMRLTGEDIEVFVSSDGEENPYEPGDREHFFGSGLYCETVIRSGRRLVVPDALADPEWKDNPDVKLGMTSYLGFPIRMPDGSPFGTICILDSGRREYSESIEKLVERFGSMVEHHLGLIRTSQALGGQNASYQEQLEQIEALKEVIPICAWCRNVRTEEGYWRSVEQFLDEHPQKIWSHGICPDCRDRHFDEEPNLPD